jgi:TonB family protein
MERCTGVAFAMLFVLAALLAPSAHAQTGAPCDASRPVKACRAEIRFDGKYIQLTSSTAKCSVVDWAMDGSRRSTTILDGEERIELLTTKPRELEILRCTEVKDLRAIGASDDEEGSSLQPVYRQVPEYPPAMRRGDIEGVVEVEVQVRPNGSVSSARVISSPHPGLDQAALAAAYAWRFAPTPRGGEEVIPFRFELTD